MKGGSGFLNPDRFTVILSRPDSPENVGLAARAMKNTGFSRLRLVTGKPLRSGAYITAVHAHEILENSQRFSDLDQAVQDLNVVFAASARRRKNFPGLPLSGLIPQIKAWPPGTGIGLLFGNERTGLSSHELRRSSFRIVLPQASQQPSYNLASAVLLVLFHLFVNKHKENSAGESPSEIPLPRSEQDACIELILKKLELLNFIHSGNREHIRDRVYDLFGRTAMTEPDRRLLLAIFSNLDDMKK
ncbi:MAG: RNA methyltransferase [Candidatus Aminicenantaceae bacterium]